MGCWHRLLLCLVLAGVQSQRPPDAGGGGLFGAAGPDAARPLPRLGFGISGLGKERTGSAVSAALRAGFRLFDSATAPSQGSGFNYEQAALGEALQLAQVPREELYLITKVHPMDFGYTTTMEAVARACAELRVTYIDVVLLHWPYCMEEFCGRGQEGVPVGDALDAYTALVEAQRLGVVRQVGISNFDAALLSELLEALVAEGLPAPSVLQNPVDPINPPPRPLLRLLDEHDILLQGTGLLAFDMRVLKRGALTDRRSDQPLSPVATHLTVQRIAARHHADPNLVPFAWALEHGWAALYCSSREERIADAARRLLPAAPDALHLAFHEVAAIDADLDGYIRTGVLPQPSYRNPFDSHLRLDTLALATQDQSPGLGKEWCGHFLASGEYDRAGFAVVRGIMEASAVASVYRAVRRILQHFSHDAYGSMPARGARAGPVQHNASTAGDAVMRPVLPASLFDPGEEYSPTMKYDMSLRSQALFDPVSIAWMAPLVLNRQLLDFVSCTLQTEEVRLAFLPFLRATPLGPAHFDWHQDWSYLRGRVTKDLVPSLEEVEEVFGFAESLLVVHVPLTEIKPGSGGLSYAEGSHRHGMDIMEWSPLYKDKAFHEEGGPQSLRGTHFVRERGEIINKVVEGIELKDSPELHLQLGDFLAHSAFTWHRAQPRTMPGARWHAELYFQDARAPLRAEPVELLLRSRSRPTEVVDTLLKWTEAVLVQQPYWEEICADRDSLECV